MREYICYHPPKGNLWGHTMRHRTVTSAWNAIQSFLHACTIAEPMRLRALTVYGDPPWDDLGVADTYLSAVTARFGPHHEVSRCRLSSPDGHVQEWQDHRWNTERLEPDAVLAYLTSQTDWPTRRRNVVSARFDIPFQWRDPLTGERLAGQDAGFPTEDGALRSMLSVDLGARTHIEPGICIPCPEGSPNLPPFLRFIQLSFPATLHDKHFRVATPKTRGGGYTVRRMVIPPSVTA